MYSKHFNLNMLMEWYRKKIARIDMGIEQRFKGKGSILLSSVKVQERERDTYKIERGPHLCVIGWATLESNTAGRPKVSYLSKMSRETG